MLQQLQQIITTGISSKHNCIECWNDTNQETLQTDINLIQMCILAAETIRNNKSQQIPSATSIQVSKHGILLNLHELCIAPDVLITEKTFTDPREALAASVLVGTHWSARTMISFTISNTIIPTESFQQIIMGLEPNSTAATTIQRSRIFHQIIQSYGKELKTFINEHVPLPSTKSKLSTSQMQRFVVANVPLGGKYNFGYFLDSNPNLNEISLVCSEIGGTKDHLSFTSKGKRLGIGDTFHPYNITLTSLFASLHRMNQNESGGVTHVDLSGNGLCSTHVEMITKYLTSSECAITHLNLAYNSFDMSEKEYEKIVTETGDGGAKMAPLIENEDSIPNHPFLELMVRGIMNNSTITTLDVTGCCRFGMIDPSKSCDPDDRELMTSAVRKRPRMSIERADSYTLILLRRLERALEQNNCLECVRLGELELDIQHIDSLQKAMRKKGGGGGGGGSSSSSSSSSLSGGNRKRRRVVDKVSVETTKRW